DPADANVVKRRIDAVPEVLRAKIVPNVRFLLKLAIRHAQDWVLIPAKFLPHLRAVRRPDPRLSSHTLRLWASKPLHEPPRGVFVAAVSPHIVRVGIGPGNTFTVLIIARRSNHAPLQVSFLSARRQFRAGNGLH